MNSIFVRKGPRSKAFTLLELLVVLAVIAVLLALQLPGMARVQTQSRKAQCAANLRQLGLAHILYGTDNADRLPARNVVGVWLWDTPVSVTDALAKYGAQRQQFYCPAYPEQNFDGLWNFSLPSFRVIGYALTLSNSTTLIPSDANGLLTPQQITVGVVFLPANPASNRVLLADASLSDWGQVATAQKLNYKYVDIAGAYTHHSAHLDINGRYPAGNNVGMLDAHVEWRPFSTATCHTSGGSPGFWW